MLIKLFIIMVDEANNQTNTASTDDSGQIDDDILKQFKMIIGIVFIILFLFLAYFVYNLIKCYLPKWKKKLQEDQLKPAKIESEQKKEGDGVLIEL